MGDPSSVSMCVTDWRQHGHVVSAVCASHIAAQARQNLAAHSQSNFRIVTSPGSNSS